MMLPNAMTVLRALQAIFAIITLGLDASVADYYNSSEFLISCPSQIAFLVFTSVYTLLIILPYTIIAPRYFGMLANQWAMLSAEATTMLFWFGGFVASADFIGKLQVCRGVVCSSAIAGTVLGSFEFILFAGTTYFAIQHIIGNSRSPNLDKEGSILSKRNWFGREKYAERI